MTLTASRITFEAIGTHWEIDIHDSVENPIEPERLSKIESAVQNRIEIYDKTYSRFRPDSLISRISKTAGSYTFPADAAKLFDLYARLYAATEGAVTPLIGNLISDAGYDADYSLRPSKKLQSPAAWDEVMTYRHPILVTRTPVLLDFGAAGKGYLIDIIGRILHDNGLESYLIDAGGDMLHRGRNGARIGLENPEDPSEVLGIVNVENESICGSAGNRRSWAGIHHIMNPHTLEPARDVLAAWAIAPTALVADGIATALFFTPAAILKQSFAFEYFLVRADMSCEYSNGLNDTSKLYAEIFTGAGT